MTSLYPNRAHIRDVVVISEDSIRVTLRSPMGDDSTVDVNVSFDAFDHWATDENVMIQEAMPDVSVDDRELLMTGMTTQQWDLLGQIFNRECES